MLSSDLLKAKQLSAKVKGLGISPSKTPSIRAYVTQAPPPSDEALRAIIEPLVREHLSRLEAPSLIVNQDLVKEIVSVMHTLPENDKLEVSKGIRNANSFIYGKTKYAVSEMMHGGGADLTVTVSDTALDLSAQADGVNKSFTVPSGITPLLLVGTDAPINYRLNVDYVVSGTVLTLTSAVNAPSLGSTLTLLYRSQTTPPPTATQEFTTTNASETVNGSTTTFTFSGATSQPIFVVSDNVLMRAVSNIGTINWTWNSTLKQVTLAIPPQDDIVAITDCASSIYTASEIIDGLSNVFTFASATAQPAFLVVDNFLMQPTASNGVVNWSWNNSLKQATVSFTPQDDIVALSAPSVGVIPATQIVDGITSVFTFLTSTAQPSFVVVDGGMERATSSAGTINWSWNTGSLSATLSTTPQTDVIALV